MIYLDFKRQEKFNKLEELRDNQVNLPVAWYIDEIVDAVRNGSVAVIAGDRDVENLSKYRSTRTQF